MANKDGQKLRDALSEQYLSTEITEADDKKLDNYLRTMGNNPPSDNHPGLIARDIVRALHILNEQNRRGIKKINCRLWFLTILSCALTGASVLIAYLSYSLQAREIEGRKVRAQENGHTIVENRLLSK